MSFILDALRRAENQRGYQLPQPSAEATLEGIAAPVSARPSGRKIATVAISLAALAAALLYLTRANDGASEQTRPVTAEDVPAAPLPGIHADTPLAEVVATQPRVVRSLEAEVHGTSRQYADPAGATARPVVPGTVVVAADPLTGTAADETPERMPASNTEPDTEQLPGYQELVLSGRVQLPQLHLDIHVYAPERTDRFVFVNNRKYKEGDRLDEGGTVERITAAGVVLNHRGHRFELLPD